MYLISSVQKVAFFFTKLSTVLYNWCKFSDNLQKRLRNAVIKIYLYTSKQNYKN